MKINFLAEIKQEDKLSNYQIIDLLLKKRGIKNVSQFINPKEPWQINLNNFSLSFNKEFEKTIKILNEIKEKDQMIVVYTDYDADGITGGAILWETLYFLGFKVMPYVPDRKSEGYGFSIKGINNVIKKFNPKLIISVDHGITKIKEVNYAQKKDIKVIITDHHLKAKKSPKAEAIFHIPELSGSGVAYFFAKEIFNSFLKKNNQKNHIPIFQLKEYFKTDYLAIASIGTIADLVPLLGASRSLVKFGLKAFKKIKRPGIKSLIKEAGLEGKNIGPYEIGFFIAPRINAVGRLKDATDALRLLCTKKTTRAKKLAFYLNQKNQERQTLVEKSVEEAKNILKFSTENFKILPKIIIISSNHWHEGIIGLIAAKLTEEFYRPTIILTKNDGFYKASARSISQFHITNFLKSLKNLLVDVGGHAQAAGFTIEEKNLDNFINEAEKKANQLIKDRDLEKIYSVDLKIPIEKINLSLIKNIETLAPFGIGNPKPIFYSEGIITTSKIFGKKNNHLKIYVSDENIKKNFYHKSISIYQTPLELIIFNQSSIFPSLFREQKIKVIYTLEINNWQNKERLLGKVIKLIL